jgi:hypothetical protein
MPETFEGKIQMAKIEQKLDDHVATQTIDMNEIKSGVTRIEAKLDNKADRGKRQTIACQRRNSPILKTFFLNAKLVKRNLFSFYQPTRMNLIYNLTGLPQANSLKI